MEAQAKADSDNPDKRPDGASISHKSLGPAEQKHFENLDDRAGDSEAMSVGKENRQDQKDFERFCFECNWPLAKSRHLINIDGKVYKWHPECFKCNICNNPLDKETSCHIYKDKIVCRDDFAKLRRDSTKLCCRCRWPIAHSDWVRKVGIYVYHLACFSCDICLRQLSTGERFAIDIQSKGSVRILCQRHFQTVSTNSELGQPDRDGQICILTPEGGRSQDGSGQPAVKTNHNQSEASTRSTTFEFDVHENSRLKLYHPLNQLLDQDSGLASDPSQHLDQRQNCSFQAAVSFTSNHQLLCQASSNHQNGSHPFLLNHVSSSSFVPQNDGSAMVEFGPGPSAGMSIDEHRSGLSVASTPPSSGSSLAASTMVSGGVSQVQSKSKRVRTTFTEEQLSILQTHFQIDSNPDGQDLERIATITGLSKRVTQVWFQNSRARQKKYLIKRKPNGGGGPSGTGAINISTAFQSKPNSGNFPISHQDTSLKTQMSENMRPNPQFSTNRAAMITSNETDMFQSGDDKWSTSSSGSSSSLIANSLGEPEETPDLTPVD